MVQKMLTLQRANTHGPPLQGGRGAGRQNFPGTYEEWAAVKHRKASLHFVYILRHLASHETGF